MDKSIIIPNEPALYPYYSKDYVCKHEARMNELVKEIQDLNIYEFINKEKKEGQEFNPGDKLRELMRKHLLLNDMLDDMRTRYRFAIEVNAAVACGRKTFKQIDVEANEYLLDLKYSLGTHDLSDQLKDWIDQINQPNKSQSQT